MSGLTPDDGGAALGDRDPSGHGVGGGLPSRPVDLTALGALRASHPQLAGCVEPLVRAARALTGSLERGGTVFLAGNGGSMADALHIAGELRKSFERPRPIPPGLRERLVASEGGNELADHLQAGLRVLVLGADPVLASAAANDIDLPHVVLAQDLVALGRAGDALLAISTSGRSPNVVNAAVTAKALGMVVLVLTGNGPPGRLSSLADVVVRAPGTGTAEVQGWHSQLYHALCRMLEDTFFHSASEADANDPGASLKLTEACD